MPPTSDTAPSSTPGRGELQAARGAAQILAAVARATWFKERDDGDCPGDRIPTPAALVEWIPAAPPDSAPPALASATADTAAAAVEAAHDDYLELGPPHPLGRIVRLWQESRPLPPDRRATGIMPQTLPLRAATPARKDTLADPADSTAWPALGPVEPPYETGWLPGFESPPSKVTPAPPLVIYDAADHTSTSRGGGANLALRLAVELLMAVPRYERAYRGRRVIEMTLGELLAWLWPNGAPSPSRYWPNLRIALRALHNAQIPFGDKELWQPFAVRLLPRHPLHPSARLRFEVEMPPGSQAGPRIYRPTLRAYGLRTATAYRAWLSLSYMWHEHLVKPRMRPTGVRWEIAPPQLPQVRRDKQTGGILDAHGKPVLRPNGAPQLQSTHPAAVPILNEDGEPAVIHNGEMDRLPELGPDDLVVLTHPNPATLVDGARRIARHRARATIEKMAAEQDVVLEESGDGVRILPPLDIAKRFRR